MGSDAFIQAALRAKLVDHAGPCISVRHHLSCPRLTGRLVAPACLRRAAQQLARRHGRVRAATR